MAATTNEALRKRARAAAVLGYVALFFVATGVFFSNLFGTLLWLIALTCSILATLFGRGVRKQINEKQKVSKELQAIRGTATRGMWFGGGILIATATLLVLGIIFWSVLG